jgi:poly(A) polymerase
MIRRFLKRVFAPSNEPAPAKIPRSRHGISAHDISSAAKQVTTSLTQSRHKAFVVGGAVRDLLLKRRPKDFDVVTSATPDQVRALFRRSRIIGRRFRLVQVIAEGDIVEVSTFRGSDVAREVDERGRVLRDNIFGTQSQDAARRDFTVNALFYDCQNETILDYHGGYADLLQRRLKMIGDPEARYREDPVRMLRAVRLSATLSLKLDPAAAGPIARLASLLQFVPAARVFDEMLKLLLSGHAAECIRELRAQGLHHGLLPLLDVILEQPLGERFVWSALGETDERIREGKPVSPSFLFATLLWHEVLSAWNALEAKGVTQSAALKQAMDEVIDVQTEKLAVPRRFTAMTKEIWALQPRFLHRSGARACRLLAHPRFRAGFDFFNLRARSGEVEIEIAEWWRRFQAAEADERKAMLLPGPPKGRRRRRRVKAVSPVPATS